MRLELKKIGLRNFKGAQGRVVTFDGNTKVYGANSTGKSTLADAWYWLWCDCNTALAKNPPITPIGMSECESRVDAELEIDGKPLSVAKSQKFKSKEVDGKTTTSITNTYYINEVEKSYKDFIADLTERGIDMESFLIFSHPAAFTNDTSKQGREKMRSILFKMCEGISDADIAKEIDVNELNALLETYKLDEIEQMQKSTLKKIKDNVGVDNSIINARIDEVLSQKSTLDKAVLEEQKRSYEAEIERCDSELADLNGGKNEMAKRCLELRDKRSELIRKAKENLYNEREELEAIKHDLESTLKNNEFQLREAEREAERTNNLLKEAKADLENQRTHYKMEQDAVMDESDLSCPLCHTSYSESKVKKLKAEFERNKAEKLKTIKSMGEDIKSRLKGYEDALSAIQRRQQTLKDVISATDGMLIVTKEKLNKIPSDIDRSQFAEIDSEIAKLESELMEDEDDRKSELESAKNVARQMLNQIIADLGTLEKNVELDKRVAELREERRQSEINKAKAEKILDEVEMFKREKNNRLSAEINKHFKVAQFRLFKTLKNGSIEEALDVLVNGKEINTQVNQATQVLAKLDIIKGLSDYFETWIPVFVDDASLITQDTFSMIDMPNQTIWLFAKDGINELKVERG